MATWAERSFALVDRGGYLDELIRIYRAPAPCPRPVAEAQLERVRAALLEADDLALLAALLELERFPFNNPFVGFFRKDPGEMRKNPATVRVICEQVRSLGVERLLHALGQPKETNRQMGPMFRRWLMTHYLSERDAGKLRASSHPVVLLDAGGKALRRFANEIGCGIQKEPDFVARAGNRYVVGEAKWIGTEGGNQNRAFEDALRLAGSSFASATTVAVLDGVVWLRGSGQMSRRLANFSGNALSALLLDEFLGSL